MVVKRKSRFDDETPAKRKEVYSEGDIVIDDAVLNMFSADTVEQHILGNYAFWQYAENSLAEGTLINAYQGNEITGYQRFRPISTQIKTFWDLHSRFIAPSGKEVLCIYQDILAHCLILDTFQDKDARAALVEAMASECGKPDEAEKSREEFRDVFEEIHDSGVTKDVVTMFLQTAYLPNPTEDHVNPDIIDLWYFRKGGVLDLCVREIIGAVQTYKDLNGNDDGLIQRDLENQQYRKIIRSFILLARECRVAAVRTVKLNATFWAVDGVQDADRSSAMGRINDIFVYSNVDSGHGIDRLLKQQRNAIKGKPKQTAMIPSAHGTRFPPFRTKNGEFPVGSVMPEANYRSALKLIDDSRFLAEPGALALMPPPLERDSDSDISDITPGAGAVVTYERAAKRRRTGIADVMDEDVQLVKYEETEPTKTSTTTFVLMCLAGVAIGLILRSRS